MSNCDLSIDKGTTISSEFASSFVSSRKYNYRCCETNLVRICCCCSPLICVTLICLVFKGESICVLTG